MQVVVIGGGASGLCASLFLARGGVSVTLLEQNEKCGKKLLASGNGRCNLTNTDWKGDYYECDDPSFLLSILQKFPPSKAMDFFANMGLLLEDKKGWIYPRVMQASAVRDLLLLELQKNRVKIKTREHVKAVEKGENAYLVVTESWKYEADAVLAATGSLASQVEGTSDFALSIADAFHIQTLPFLPSLVPLKAAGKRFAKWSGTRVHGTVTLKIDQTEIVSERGEIQLTDYGISGIPVFQLSSKVARAVKEKKNVEIMLDFLPEYTKDLLVSMISRRIDERQGASKQSILLGMLPEKLIPILMEGKPSAEELAGRIKAFSLSITGTLSEKYAQVCQGGILLSELTENMEARQKEGLYFIGEACNVNGRCGGYNLQWAFASAYAASQGILQKCGKELPL